ncbi:MAG: response regulator, partial [bacterium]|nr:response regulator [bacterium]
MKKNPKILLIDDKPWWSGFSQKVLSEHGYKVDIAHDEEGALRRLDSRKYDILLPRNICVVRENVTIA